MKAQRQNLFTEWVMNKRFFHAIRSLSKIISLLVGIYLGIFSVTSSLYTAQVNSLDKEIDILKERGKFAWERISYLQNMKLIVEPDITNPYSIYLSILSLFPEERKEVSGKHIHRLQEIIQTAERGALRNISFKSLILAPKFAITNGEIKNATETDNYYINFQRSDFQESAFVNSLFSNLDLTSSNFCKSRFDKTNIIASRLKNVNMENTVLLEVNFYKSLLLDTNAKNTIISDSLFDHSQLTNTDFSGARITNSSFRNTNLQGANFNNVIFFYDDKEFLRNSFKYAIFNSKKIDANNLDRAYRIAFKRYKKYVQLYCNKAIKDQDAKNVCIETLIFNYSKLS